jgi:hypothetical protein
MYKKTKKFRLKFNKQSHKNNPLNQHGGGWGENIINFFRGKKKQEPIETSKFLSDSQNYTNNNALNTINDKRKSSANTDTLFTASTVLTATQAVLPALALTGIGAPAATALGALVVLVNKMVTLYRNNILLYIAMTDALSIISKSYLLYELILRSYFIISSEKLIYTVKCPGYNVQTFSPKIDDFQNSRLKAKLDELIVLLFGIMQSEDIKFLLQDEELKNTPLGVLLIKEDTKRKDEFKIFGKLNRSLLKKFSSEWYNNEFSKTLTYISGILFNIYVLNKSHVERIKKESQENREKYENLEECSQERINFDNPNLKRTTEAALDTFKEGDNKIFVDGIIREGEIIKLEQKQELTNSQEQMEEIPQSVQQLKLDNDLLNQRKEEGQGQVEQGQVEEGQVEQGQVEQGQVEQGQVEQRQGQVEQGQVEQGQVEQGQGQVEQGQGQQGQRQGGSLRKRKTRKLRQKFILKVRV